MTHKGFRTAGEAEVVRFATSRGWKRLRRTGSNHIRLLWPPKQIVHIILSKMDDGFVQQIKRQLLRLEQRDSDGALQVPSSTR
jgi:hypothetical protein